MTKDSTQSGELSGYHDLTRLTQWLRLGQFVYCGLAIIGVWSSWVELELLQAVRSGEVVGTGLLQSNDNRESIVGAIDSLCYVILVVLYLRWVYVAKRNSGIGQSRPSRYSPGVAAGSYFIPFVNIWKPFQALRELWRESQSSEIASYGSDSTPRILTVWWILHLIHGWLGYITLRVSLRSDNLESLAVADWLCIMLYLIAIPTALMLAAILRAIHGLQSSRAKALGLTAHFDAQGTVTYGHRRSDFRWALTSGCIAVIYVGVIWGATALRSSDDSLTTPGAKTGFAGGAVVVLTFGCEELDEDWVTASLEHNREVIRRRLELLEVDSPSVEILEECRIAATVPPGCDLSYAIDHLFNDGNLTVRVLANKELTEAFRLNMDSLAIGMSDSIRSQVIRRIEELAADTAAKHDIFSGPATALVIDSNHLFSQLVEHGRTTGTLEYATADSMLVELMLYDFGIESMPEGIEGIIWRDLSPYDYDPLERMTTICLSTEEYVLTDESISSASVGESAGGLPSILYELTAEGAQNSKAVTSRNIGKSVSIVLDGVLLSTPTIEGVISTTGTISGHGLPHGEVERIVRLLKSGSYEAPVMAYKIFSTEEFRKAMEAPPSSVHGPA